MLDTEKLPRPEPSILMILWLIGRRPSLYLGPRDASRRDQLLALQAVITGYTLALLQHGVGQADLGMVGELEDFLRERSGADRLSGIDQLLATAPTDEAAWERVWSLIDEFRALKGHVP